jgi:O-antigen/teichoic acid export membrane protein
LNLKINTIWNIVESVIAFAVALIVTRLLIQNFGMLKYGLFVTLSMLSGYGIISLFDLGMTGAAVTFAARYKNAGLSNELRKLWCFCLFYFFSIASFAVILLVILIMFDMGSILTKIQSSEQGLEILYPAFILTFLSFFSFAFVSFLQAFELYRPLQLVNILGHLTRLSTAFYVLSLSNGLYLFFWVMVGIKLVTIVVLFFILVTSVNELKSPLTPSFKLVKEWGSYSLILFGSAIVGFFMNMLDKILIAANLPFSDMGRYDVANKPANGLRMGFSVLYSALEPATIRAYVVGSEPAVRNLYNKSTFYISSIITPLIIVSFFNMENILNAWLGSADDELVYLAIAAACYLMVIIHASVANIMLVAVGAAGKILPIQILSAFIVFISMIFLINIYGLFGCVLAIFLGYLISSILMLRYFFRFFMYKSIIQLKSIIFHSIFILSISIVVSWLFTKLNFSGHFKLYELAFICLIELMLIYLVLYTFFILRKKEEAF